MENKNIDKLYEKVLNSDVESIKNVLNDDDADLIATTIDEMRDPDMLEAKEMASKSNLTDKAFEGVTMYNNETGAAMYTEEIDYDNVIGFDELLNSDKVKLPDIDTDLTITKINIANFFALDFSDEAFESAGITDEVCEKLLKLSEKYRVSKITGKKFPYFNAMPESIQKQIIIFHGTDVTGLTGRNMIKTARNYIASCLMERINTSRDNETLSIDLEQSIAKLNEQLKQDTEELARDKEWSKVTWKYYLKTIPVQAAVLESKGLDEQAEKYRKAIAAFEETCTFKTLIKEIEAGLRLPYIMIKDFDKCCELFNSKYEKSEYTIYDIKLAYNALCNNPNISGDEEVFKRFITYFIAYCNKYNLSTENVLEHEYMYYFIWNILFANLYNDDDEEDVEFHMNYYRSLQNALNVVKRTMEEK